MSTGKVVANAGSHRILDALLSGPKNSRELKNVVGAINSLSRFESEYMGRMLDNGYVCRSDDGLWHATKSGRRKCEELGPVVKNAKREVVGPRVANTGLDLQHTPVPRSSPLRAGSMDFSVLPSRVGDKLYYRDGTIKEIGHGD